MSETICPPFTFVKGGVYYFSRRIPKDLKSHYLAQATTKPPAVQTRATVTPFVRAAHPPFASARAKASDHFGSAKATLSGTETI